MFLSCCIVYRCVLLFSFTRCRYILSASVLSLGPFFSVRLCSSTCIWGVVLVLLSFCPHVVSRLSPHIIFWGVVISYFEASSSYLFLYWGFVLVFYIEASSSYFILRLCSSVWGLGPRCCRPMLLLFVLLIWFVCSDMCVILFLFVFVYRVTRCKHHLVWIYQPFSCFTFLCQFFSLQSCNPLFGLHASYLNFDLWLMLTHVFWYVCTL